MDTRYLDAGDFVLVHALPGSRERVVLRGSEAECHRVRESLAGEVAGTDAVFFVRLYRRENHSTVPAVPSYGKKC